jgi:hypothetical protein
MGLVESIPQVVKSMIVFAKEIPGIKELKNTGDFAIMINNRLFDYFIVSFSSIHHNSFTFYNLFTYKLKHSPLIFNNESYMMLPVGIQYTKYWMEKVIGIEMVDAIFDFSNKLNSLNLTAREISLLFPVALTAPGFKFLIKLKKKD